MVLAEVSVNECFLEQVFATTCQSLLEPLLSLREELGTEQAVTLITEEQRQSVTVLLEGAIGSLFSRSAATNTCCCSLSIPSCVIETTSWSIPQHWQFLMCKSHPQAHPLKEAARGMLTVIPEYFLKC